MNGADRDSESGTNVLLAMMLCHMHKLFLCGLKSVDYNSYFLGNSTTYQGCNRWTIGYLVFIILMIAKKRLQEIMNRWTIMVISVFTEAEKILGR